MLGEAHVAWHLWTRAYGAPFHARFGVSIPSPVPQTNDVRDPVSGAPIDEACR